MRISHHYRFIFLATPRTGSTSVRSLLDPHSDIKSVHKSEITSDFPFYHHISALELKSIFQTRQWDWGNYRTFCVVRNPYDRVVSLYHHHQKMMASILARANPVRRWLVRGRELIRPTKTFNDYVRQLNPQRRVPTSLPNFLCDRNGNFLVDDVLRFEDLSQSLPTFMRQMGIDVAASDLPHVNASENRTGYREYYDDWARQRVGELYAYEIERFGYSF